MERPAQALAERRVVQASGVGLEDLQGVTRPGQGVAQQGHHLAIALDGHHPAATT